MKKVIVVFSIITSIAVIGICFPDLALAYDFTNVEVKADETPKDLQGVGITEHLGESIDLTNTFVDSNGKTVQLAQFFSGKKPVLMAMVYYNCPNLCHYQLDGMLASLKKLDWTVGKDFELVTVSMDHREKPVDAALKKVKYVDEYGRSGSEQGWHLLTGSEQNIKKLAQQVGFGFKWNEAQKQYAHAAAAYLISPAGKISRYLYGIEYNNKDLKFSLMDASDGKIGNVVDRLIFYCFQFDPKKNKYTLYAINLMKAGATVAVIVMTLFLVPVWIRSRKEKGALK